MSQAQGWSFDYKADRVKGLGFRVYNGVRGYIGIMGKNMGKTGMGLGFRVIVYWDYIGTMEKNMETTI